jgi:GntP family gluconate:H+ symporter
MEFRLVQGPVLLVILVVAFLFIIIATVKFKVHAFYVLIVAAFGTGVAAGIPATEVLKKMIEGFGNTMGYIGIIIIAGTTIGVFLERSGAAFQLAQFTLRRIGENRVPLSVSIFGFTVSIPIFCDSGFVVLSPLNRALAARAKISMSVMAVVLASALYTTHCLVPPHPGPTAVVASFNEVLGQDIMGRVVVFGLLAAIPGVITGYWWATRYAKKFFVQARPEIPYENLINSEKKLPGFVKSLLPILLPVILIGLKSFALLPSAIEFIGVPTAAMLIGVVAALFLVPRWNAEILSDWLGDGVKAAGIILAITAAGGSFGTILRETGVGDYLGQLLSQWKLGLFIPFLIAAAIKTAQGSSTVAIITTAPLIASLLPSLGLDSEWGAVFAVLAMGAGSMVVSHANDSYFWVVTKFSELDTAISFKVYTTATLLIGVVSMIFIVLLYLLIT